MSLENLFKTRPMGLVSKKRMGALRMEANIRLWSTREAFTHRKKKAMVLVRLRKITPRTVPPYIPTLWSTLRLHSCRTLWLVSSKKVRLWLEQSALRGEGVQ